MGTDLMIIANESLKILITTIKGINALRKEVEINTIKEELLNIIIPLQENIIKIGQQYNIALQDKSNIEKELSDLINITHDMSQYELTTLETNVTVYRSKQTNHEKEKPHYVCANCYNNFKKIFILNPAEDNIAVHICSKCRTKYQIILSDNFIGFVHNPDKLLDGI